MDELELMNKRWSFPVISKVFLINCVFFLVFAVAKSQPQLECPHNNNSPGSKTEVLKERRNEMNERNTIYN